MLDFQPNSDALSGKTILVTGAGDGIGKEAALQFARYGANVILLGRTIAKLEATYDLCEKQSNAELAIVPLDLEGATVKHYQDMASTIENQFGKLDGLLHNASLLGQLQPFGQIPEAEFRQVMQVNLNGQFFMTQALLPVLKKAPNASVVFTSSSVGVKGRAYWGTYAISKFATEGMMQCLADEYSNSTMRFNCINPGGTRTGMRAKAFPAENPESLKTPTDIMPAYLYLMADASIGVTGETLNCQPK
ncbi:YciK family oxidoreductase [Planctobacterium marinum]|uniref:YciK family oxidoreductase n=1 Tax=Planctobacterium marinum TaxID=1631968 RepID=A0AA48HVN2_9ALTE|nr:YciK family oxidoreductase [Planctobacterium marinum]